MPKRNGRALRLAYLRVIVGGRRALAGAGMGGTAALVVDVMLRQRRLWSVSEISLATGLTRVTVRKFLLDAMAAGRVERLPRGFRLTAAGEVFVFAAVDSALMNNGRSLNQLFAARNH